MGNDQKDTREERPHPKVSGFQMTAPESTAINDASKRVLTPAEQLAKQREEAAHRILLENGGTGPGKKFTADELLNRETSTRAKVAEAVQSFDPANPLESMRKFAQFSSALAQQDNQFKTDIGPRPTAPNMASAHAEGYLMRTEANYAANVYIKMAQYLHDHQDDATAKSLVPELNSIWKQIGKLEPRILSDSGFQNVLAQTNKNLAAPIASQLDTSKPAAVAKGPEIRVAAETQPGSSTQAESAQMGLRSAQSSQPVPPPLGHRNFEVPAQPAAPTPPPLGHRNFSETPVVATTGGDPPPTPAAKKPAADSTQPPAAPKLILTNSQWDARNNELNTLEKGLWGPYQQNQDKYNQALADATAVSDAAKAKFGTNSDFMQKFITSADNNARTALLHDPKYAVKGSPLETAALNFMKYGDKTTSVLKWAIDHSVLAEAKKVADGPAPASTKTAVGQLEADAVSSEAAYNKTNKAQVDQQLRQELDATKAARLAGDDTGAIEHMRKADAIILTMAAPAVNRRWLGEEYREQANGIDPLKEKDQQQAVVDLTRKNDFSLHSKQQFQLAVQNSQLLNQDLLNQASTELATLMQRTVVGNQALTNEFGAMQGKIKGVGNDGSESMLDMTYQNAKTLATMQLESQHFEEAKQALATAIAYKKWTPETAPQNDPEYTQLASRIAAGLPENERGQIAHQDNIYRRSWEEISGIAGYALGATLFGKFMPASMKESYLGKAAAGTLTAGISANLANQAMSGPRDSMGEAALNGIIAPAALHGAMRLGGALAEGIAPKVGDSIFGEAVTKDKLVESIANRVGDGKLNAGQLYDFAQSQKIGPETIGLHAPKDAAALARWRATPVFEDGKVVYPEADLLGGTKTQLNQVASQMFSRPAKLVLPKQTMTKDEVVDWLKKNGRTDSALRLQSVDGGAGDEVIIRNGKPIPALRPRLLGYDETEIAGADATGPAKAPAAPKLTDAQAAEVLSDLPAPSGRIARMASRVGQVAPSVGRSVINTVRSGAGIRSVDILNDSPDVIANGLKWRAAYASPFIGNFAAFAETPVLQRLGKEITGTESVKEANLTVGQLNAGAADLHVGSKQLLRQDLVADAAGNPITDNTMLIQNGERQPLFVKDKAGGVRPLAPDENILQTSKAQNARLLRDFVEENSANKERKLVGKLAGAKGGDVYAVSDLKADLRKLNIDPDNLSNSKLLNELPDDTPLVVKGKVQKTVTVNGAEISLKPGFGLSDAQSSVVSGSLTPIEKSTLLWHKNEGIVKKAVNTVAPPIDLFGIKITGNPIYPELTSTGVFARAKGQLNNFNVLDASTKQIENQLGWSRMKSYVPAYLLGAEAPMFASTYLNSKYDASGQPLTAGQRWTAAVNSLEVPSWLPATVKSDDPSKESDLKTAFWDTKDSDQAKWMADFNDRVDRIYADQGHVTIRAFDDDGSGKLKVEGRIGGKQVFLIDKLRDRTPGIQDDGLEGLGAYALWAGPQAWSASSIERTRILAPGFQAFVNNRLKPLTWLTPSWKDGFRSITAPAATIERQNTESKFEWDGIVEGDYQDAASGKRQIQYDLPPETKLITSDPNNPGQQTPGTAQQIEAP